MLEERARELGRQIGQTSEYKAVKRATEAVEGDPTIRGALKQIEELRHRARDLMEQGGSPTPEMEDEMNALLLALQGNPIYQSVIVAQENYEKMMIRVNEGIAEGIKKGAASSIITLG